MVRKNYFLLIIFSLIAIVISSYLITALNCWQYTSIANGCTSSNGCTWKNDSWSTTGWCEELNCWSLNTQSSCTTTNVPGKNCTWQPGGTSYGCEKLSCWSLSGTNSSSCESNTAGLNCQWSNYCYNSGSSSGVSPNCWSYQNQSSCVNVTGCSWGQCMEKGCWSYNSSATCNAAKDWNGKNCTWNSNNYCDQNGCWKYNQTLCTNTSATSGLNCQWKYNSCQDFDCYSWDFTNATACINNSLNLSCTWSGSYCTKQDCWNYNSQSTCQNQTACLWKSYVSSGWCNEVNCWSWDSWNGGNQTSCVSNSYSLSCSWTGNPPGNTTGGWCYKNMATVGCSNFTAERSCMDTFYCWWQYTDWNNASAGGSCNSPGSFGGTITNTNNTVLNEWNPGCYTFDMNSTDCNRVLGCNYSTAAGKCIVLNNSFGNNITENGINCTYINDSTLCNNIPILSSCCSWQNGTCVANKLSTTCRDQMTVPPVGASFCEDYNSYENQVLCEQIAGNPWYMPCQWDNSTSKCKFKASDVFGNDTQSIVKIDNKKNCEAAGGKWVTENYCEGTISIPAGRCEYKYDDEDNCDKACYACEKKDSSGNSINSTNAESACEGSSLGICEYTASTLAANGIGFCKAKDQYKTGVASDCNSYCGDCTYKGDPTNNDTTKRPSYYCANSKANNESGGCKWITDNSTTTGGNCMNKGEKTCEDACDRCNSQTTCSNLGRTAVSNQTGSCKWQGSSTAGSCVANTGQDVEICWDGIDNNNDNLVDCSDPSCYADSSCGFVSGDCFGWITNASCISHDCEWVTDNWGSWCDFKGSQCWKYNQNSSSCNGIVTVTNETLNISLARLNSNNNINTTKTFTLLNRAGGWVINSISIINSSGTSLAGNFTVNYSAQTITFSNNSFMVSGGGAGNFTNVTYQYYSTIAQSNCQWNNGTSAVTGWCEKDWSQQEVCMGKTHTACLAANGSGCNWTADSWCNGTGSGTTWCSNVETAGWCDNVNFKPKDCWKYSSSGLASCNLVSGCSWKTDSFSQPRCEVNWSSNCWQYTSNATCSIDNNCIWDVPTIGGGSGWCMNKADKCWSYNSLDTCNSAPVGRCYWSTWGSGNNSGGTCQSVCWNSSFNTQASCSSSYGCVWKQDNGWCEETEMASCSNNTNSNNQTACQGTTGCRWKTSGWCDPKSGGFSASANSAGGGGGSTMGGDCYKYDGNQSLCTNKTIINVSCGWTTNPGPSCDINWGTDCWRYNSIDSGCNATNGCWLKNDSWGSYCTNIMDQCWQNISYQSWNNTAWLGNCTSNYLCTNNSWGGCEPRCSSLESSSCTNATYSGKCKWNSGWCNPKTMNEMFTGMEAGAPVPVCVDGLDSGLQASIDIMGGGIKDMGDSYGFGAGMNDFSNSSVCNKEKLSSFVMGNIGGAGGMLGGPGSGFGQERTGNGNETVIYLVYLDTDGAQTGGCSLSHNSSATGYEFRFKYSSEWNSTTSKAIETFNAYQCDDSDWKATNIKLSTWKQKMCFDIGGPMIAVKKADLSKYPTLYDSTKDMRVYVISVGNTGNISSPSDTCGPGWTTPGSVDFEIKSAFEYGADTAKFEDILKKGYVQGEDCFNSIDDDNDGNIDCNDWDCQYSSKCSGLGVNSASFTDTSAPLVTGVKIEEYPDSVLIMYDTNKPTNGTLEWYGADSQCLNSTSGEPGKYIFPDIGIVKNNTVRPYKLWHVATIYNGATKINSTGFFTYDAPLANNVNSYYKLRVCDSNNKCSISKCSGFKLPVSVQKCGYCNFVTRIKLPSGWNVSYDVNRNGTYEHAQGQVCGPNAGMKTNYTDGRRVNIRLSKSDGTTYIEFLNASLTKTGLNDKVRTISTSGNMIHDTTKNIVGLSSEARDKIINNLHPELCRVKIPLASGALCDRLYHCDDSGENCTDRTNVSTLVDATNCIWIIPYCEFSTYKGSAAVSASSSSSSGGGGGGGGSAATTYNMSESEFTSGYTKTLAKNEKIKFTLDSVAHTIALTSVSASSITITVSSVTQTKVIALGTEVGVDLNADGNNDLSIRYASYASNKATIYVKKLSTAAASSTAPLTGEVTQEPTTQKTAETADKLPESKSLMSWLWIIGILIIIIAIVVMIFFAMRHKPAETRKRYY